MSRTSTDNIDGQGVVKNGFDYKLQTWVKDYVIQDCGHPTAMKHGNLFCCDQHKYNGKDIRQVEGHELRTKKEIPHWKPLEEAIGKEKCLRFMFMGTTEGGIHRYKHIDTRKYINIDGRGHFYKFQWIINTGTNYLHITKEEAVNHIFN